MRSRSRNLDSASRVTRVPIEIGASTGAGATGMRLVTCEVWHGWPRRASRKDQNRKVRGGTVSTETIIADEEVVEIGEVEELLVEEVSIDGLCGVY